MYRLLIYCSSTQCTVPQVHFHAVPQCSSRCRDVNMTTATHHNTDTVDYERTFTFCVPNQHVSLTYVQICNVTQPTQEQHICIYNSWSSVQMCCDWNLCCLYWYLLLVTGDQSNCGDYGWHHRIHSHACNSGRTGSAEMEPKQIMIWYIHNNYPISILMEGKVIIQRNTPV